MSIETQLDRSASAIALQDLRAVLFDLDGTLLNTAPDLIAACQDALRQHGFAPGDPAKIARCLTSGMRAMLSAAIGAKSQDPTLTALIEGPLRDSFAASYQQHICVHTAPFLGIPELLSSLSAAGLKSVVITNKYYAMAKPLLEHFSFAADLSLLLGGDSCAHAKPHPEPLLTACHALRILPKQALYVGDHLNDIKAAQAAGCYSCCALWGYGALECGDPLAWGSDFYVADVNELAQLIFKAKR